MSGVGADEKEYEASLNVIGAKYRQEMCGVHGMSMGWLDEGFWTRYANE